MLASTELEIDGLSGWEMGARASWQRQVPCSDEKDTTYMAAAVKTDNVVRFNSWTFRYHG